MFGDVTSLQCIHCFLSTEKKKRRKEREERKEKTNDGQTSADLTLLSLNSSPLVGLEGGGGGGGGGGGKICCQEK